MIIARGNGIMDPAILVKALGREFDAAEKSLKHALSSADRDVQWQSSSGTKGKYYHSPLLAVEPAIKRIRDAEEYYRSVKNHLEAAQAEFKEEKADD